MSGAPELDAAHYLNGFARPIHFTTGPAGYTAVVALAPGETSDLPKRVYPKPVEIHITGSLVTYDIVDPGAGKGVSVESLEGKFPGIRRFIREGFVRYAFTLFGVPYVVSIDCLDSTPRRRRLACREAYPIAEKYLNALTIAGGRPVRPRVPMAKLPIERPSELSDRFSFLPSGDIIRGTGYRGHGGHADWTVYAQMRFPIAAAPAVVGSQSYRHWDKCARRGRFPLPRAIGQRDRCGSEGETSAPVESAEAIERIVWRDNFCERRDFEAWQCPGGWGHQGQDIQAAACLARAELCRAGIDKVVAVREGDILRTPGDEGAYLIVNEPYEHFRVRHMHMDPRKMDADDLVHGRHVREGEVIGEVANYLDRPAGTSVHLHFDIQVFTREGWIWVNPYTTLIAAYERLIGARGRVFEPPSSPQQPVTLPIERPDAAPDEAEPATQAGAESADAKPQMAQ